MKMVKSLILGSAAGLVAMSGAQAADLPVKAKPVEYVRICSLYGAGFFYIPGTDTCIKLGGYLRVDTTFNGSIYDQPAYNGDLGQHNRYADYFAARSRLALTVDTRTATEYGVVRTFGQMDLNFSTFGSSTANPNSISAALPVAGTTALLNNVGEGYVGVEMAFIQFAGFTFGKSASAYATPWHGYPGNNTSYLLGGHDTVTGVNNIQYSAQFGNGVSGTIGLDDSIVYNRTPLVNLSNGLGATFTAANSYGGDWAPDVVGNIRVDQAWGLFQVSAAAHYVNGSYNNLTAASTAAGAALGLVGLQTVPAGAPNTFSQVSGHPDGKWGGSAMVALQIKNIPWGAGDDIKMDASYAKGDTKNVISTSAASPSFAMFGGAKNPFLSYASVGFGATTDGAWAPTGLAVPFADNTIHLTTAYGFRGAYNHNWDPYWSSSLFGSYSAVRYDNVTRINACTAFNAAARLQSADYSCNPNFNVSQVGFVTRWTPVKNLTFSAEAMWFHLDQQFTGSAVLAVAAPLPAARYDFSDQNTYSFNVRAQRNF
jgi:Porin subfamily